MALLNISEIKLGNNGTNDDGDQNDGDYDEGDCSGDGDHDDSLQ